MGADFNEVLEVKDKLGGAPINFNRANNLRQCLDQYNMIDLGFKGSTYTLTNKRYSNRR